MLQLLLLTQLYCGLTSDISGTFDISEEHSVPQSSVLDLLTYYL